MLVLADRQLRFAVLEVAREIVADLNLPCIGADRNRVLYACECRGGAVQFRPDLPQGLIGRCRTGEPFDGLIEALPDATAAVLIHELTHRLCLSSERYEHFNRPLFANCSREAINETIAAFVESWWCKTACSV